MVNCVAYFVQESDHLRLSDPQYALAVVELVGAVRRIEHLDGRRHERFGEPAPYGGQVIGRPKTLWQAESPPDGFYLSGVVFER